MDPTTTGLAQSGTAIAAGIHDRKAVGGLTHGFYRYPARFSPRFARSFIDELTKPGDTILDCFMGSGTTAVEATATGRNFIGCDLNSLAIFLARVKTTTLREEEQRQLMRWRLLLASRANLRYGLMPDDSRADRIPWNLRKTLGLCLDSVDKLPSLNAQRFARCSLLRTAQWALDCSRSAPSKEEFLLKHDSHFTEMLEGAESYKLALAVARKAGHRPSRRFFQCSASEVDTRKREGFSRAALLLTSPPYPGVHVLYHRWQINGRRETAAPYWVANCRDGQPSSYYTMAARRPRDWYGYMEGIRDSFKSARRMLLPHAKVIQLVAFSDPHIQFPLYMTAMAAAGFEPDTLPGINNTNTPTIRDVPNRKWYAEMQGSTAASKEYVLVHRLTKDR